MTVNHGGYEYYLVGATNDRKGGRLVWGLGGSIAFSRISSTHCPEEVSLLSYVGYRLRRSLISTGNPSSWLVAVANL